MRNNTTARLREVVTDKFVIDLNMPTEYPPIEARPTEEGGVRDRFFASVAELPDELNVIRPFRPDGFPESNKNTFYVAEGGDDSADGSAGTPLRTIEEALMRVSGLGGAKIVVRDGDYDLPRSVVIGEEHSGTATSPLIITSEGERKPRISASFSIPVSSFRPVPEGRMRRRLKPDAAEHVVCSDLRKLGNTDRWRISSESISPSRDPR